MTRVNPGPGQGRPFSFGLTGLVAAALLFACVKPAEEPPPAPARGGAGGGAAPAASGGTPGAGGGTGGSTPAPGTGGSSPGSGSGGSPASTGGSPGAGGSGTGGAPVSPGTGGSASDAGGTGGGPGMDAPPSAPTPGGKALMIVGTIPLVGTDEQVRDAFMKRGLEVETVKESMATAEMAAGKRAVFFSFSMQSDNFKTVAAFADVKAPIIVMEHNLLPPLGMTGPGGSTHGFQLGLTSIVVTTSHPQLTAGHPPGEVTVYAKTQEMFWGIPGPGAIKLAGIKGGNQDRVFYFAYPEGAMMVGKTAPAKRVHFFFAVHAPPPVKELYLNDTGLKMLQGAVDWMTE